MNIKFKDIESIISGLCCANAMLDAKIEELEEKGFDAADYRARKEKLRDSLSSLTIYNMQIQLRCIFSIKKFLSIVNPIILQSYYKQLYVCEYSFIPYIVFPKVC